MEYNHTDVPEDKELWGCAYSTNSTEKTMGFKKQPVRGIVKNRSFFEIGRNGKVKSTSVNSYARQYADTEEECVELYNSLVNRQIKLLEGLLEKTKDELIL